MIQPQWSGMVWVECGNNESQSILKYTLQQERNSPGIGLRLDFGRPVLCRAQTHSVYCITLRLLSSGSFIQSQHEWFQLLALT